MRSLRHQAKIRPVQRLGVYFRNQGGTTLFPVGAMQPRADRCSWRCLCNAAWSTQVDRLGRAFAFVVRLRTSIIPGDSQSRKVATDCENGMTPRMAQPNSRCGEAAAQKSTAMHSLGRTRFRWETNIFSGSKDVPTIAKMSESGWRRELSIRRRSLQWVEQKSPVCNERANGDPGDNTGSRRNVVEVTELLIQEKRSCGKTCRMRLLANWKSPAQDESGSQLYGPATCPVVNRPPLVLVSRAKPRDQLRCLDTEGFRYPACGMKG